MTDAPATAKVPPVPLAGAGRALEYVAGAMILAMMTVTTIDVVGRYFFSKPLWGGFETTEILMGLVVFAGMPIATARREHITIDLLDAALSWRLRCWQAALGDLVCAGIAGLLAWRVWIRGDGLLRRRRDDDATRRAARLRGARHGRADGRGRMRLRRRRGDGGPYGARGTAA